MSNPKTQPTSKVTNILLILSVAVLLFGGGYKLGEYKTISSYTGSGDNILSSGGANPHNIDFSLFWDTWNKLEQKYVDKSKVNEQKMFYGAIKGMVASVGDPYTFFLTPDENKESKQSLSGNFDGIGAQLGLTNNRIVIIAPLKDSPAEKAGVLAGDLIDKVNNTSTAGWTLNQAVAKIRGQKGTKVALTLARNNKEINVSIVRDDIHVSSVELTMETPLDCTQNCPKVADLKLNQFGENTNDEWDKAVQEIASQWDAGTIKGLVLDLRDNPGGFLESAVYLASEFLPQGDLIVKQESTTGDNHSYVSMRPGKLLKIPVVVLINKGSASAAEILSGALRDYNRATLVGEKSFGKGSVQEALDLGNGAGLHVTVAKWILPKGDWIMGKGIQPQVAVENVIPEGNTLTKDLDKQLATAIGLLLK